MQADLFSAIKTELETISSLQHVALWNNQFSNENIEIAHDYPNAFIEFANIEYFDYANGMQRYEMDVVIHMGYKSFNTDDTAVFTVKQLIYDKLNAFSSTTAAFDTRLLRRSESVDYNHGDMQDYQLVFRATGKDYGVTTLPGIDATVTTLITNIDPQITNTIIRTDKPIE